MSYCCCSTAEQVNQEFVRTMKDRMRELKLNRKMIASMACCDLSYVARVLGSKRGMSLATMAHFADLLGMSMRVAFVPKEAG